MKKNIRSIPFLVAGLLASSCVFAAKPATELNACGQPFTADQRSQVGLDIIEIQNVAASHEYYHNAWRHDLEIEHSWAKKHDDKVAWTNNTDRYVGLPSVKKFYVDGAMKMPTGGMLAYHMLTTPYIVVSGDGQSAKGIWMSFGNVTSPMGADWTQEKYAMDFVKEDGQWKILRLRTYVDFYTPNGKSWINPKDNLNAPQNLVMETGKAGVQEEPIANFEMAKPDQKANFYEGYHLNRLPALAPDMPKPYCKLGDAELY